MSWSGVREKFGLKKYMGLIFIWKTQMLLAVRTVIGYSSSE